MKKIMLVLTLIGFSSQIFASGPEIVHIINKKQAMRSIQNGWVPAFGVKARVKRWRNATDIHPKTVTFKFEKIRVRGNGFLTKEEAMVELQEKVQDVRNGMIFEVMAKHRVLQACGIHGLGDRNSRFKIVQELIDMGYVVANKFYIDDKEIDQDFNTVYRPYFIMAIPCNYKM